MSDLIRIKHLENPNMTTFIGGHQINIRNFEAAVSLEDARLMVSGPYGYELIGVYDNFIEYINKIKLTYTNLKTLSAPFEHVILGTPLAGSKLYSWKAYTDALLALENKEKIHLLITIDNPYAQWRDDIFTWAKTYVNKFYNISIGIWDSDKEKAWNRVFKITVGRQMIFNFTRSHSDVTHVWFVDSDNIIPSFALKRLLSHSRDITAGLYNFKSVIKGGAVVFNQVGEKQFPPTVLGQQNAEVKPNTGTIECDWTGAGCLLISRKIFMKYDFAWTKWTQRNGEDAWICLMGQHETGKQVLCDTSVACGHMDERGTIW